MLYSCDQQVAAKMNIAVKQLNRERIAAWQEQKIKELVSYAKSESPFYRRHLAGVEFDSLANFHNIPYLEAKHLRHNPNQLLCVSQDEIVRAVSVQSSGTTGPAKRLLYTEEDLEATRDYFGVGMAHLVQRGEKAFLLMPVGRPAGVGRLLVEGLQRRGVSAISYGVMDDVGEAVDAFLRSGATTLVGAAAHVHTFAHEWQRRGIPAQIISVLLCWDATPVKVARNVEKLLKTKVYAHWGMVETGLGGAVQCQPASGMHLREADLYLEIIDPKTGSLCADGEYGELVVTTILRRGMPLIRYRTGDYGRILPGACRCGSPCRALDPTIRRLTLTQGERLFDISFYNDIFYDIDGLIDFSVQESANGVDIFYTASNKQIGQSLSTALLAAGVVKESFRLIYRQYGYPASPGLAKRAVYAQGA